MADGSDKKKAVKKTATGKVAAGKSATGKLTGETKRRAPKPETVGDMMLKAAMTVAERSQLQGMLLYVDGLENPGKLAALDYEGELKIILVARDPEAYQRALEHTKRVVQVPQVSLTRIGQIKMAVMLSFSKRLLAPGDQFVCLTGQSTGRLDTMMVLDVGKEYEMFLTVDQPPITEHIRRAVFERVLNLALELAAEGREGKPIGAIFVLGDSDDVTENSQQNIINPFRGYPEDERNILDDRMRETVKEFATIDGAFVISGRGVIVSAGTYLLPKLLAEEIPQGLGARHAAAAAITAATKSIAITISESTGTARIWRQGRLITEIEKAKRAEKAPLDIPGETD